MLRARLMQETRRLPKPPALHLGKVKKEGSSTDKTDNPHLSELTHKPAVDQEPKVDLMSSQLRRRLFGII